MGLRAKRNYAMKRVTVFNSSLGDFFTSTCSVFLFFRWFLCFKNTNRILDIKIAVELLIFRYFLLDGGYSEWGSWSLCSRTCGDGWRFRKRSCTNPRPRYGGAGCHKLGPSVEKEECMIEECPGTGSVLLLSQD